MKYNYESGRMFAIENNLDLIWVIGSMGCPGVFCSFRIVIAYNYDRVEGGKVERDRESNQPLNILLCAVCKASEAAMQWS